FFFSSRRRHTRLVSDWSSDVCSSDLDQQGEYVYVVDAQNKAQVRRIHLGQSTPSTAVVSSGLQEGELVISEGLQRVRPGEVVSRSEERRVGKEWRTEEWTDD